ncbi:MAG: hydrogenase maturation nickel metallochaperone HypA [Bacteroidales bacterium]
MHELSLATEVIELAQREAGKRGLTVIEEILIEVGDLSGVEADAFESALGLIVKGSILEGAEIKILRTPGKAKCSGCNSEFDMSQRMATCPGCGSFPSEFSGGEEFRVVSLLAG